MLGLLVGGGSFDAGYGPGASFEVAILNRMLGVLMVWISVFFLRPERM